MLQIKVFEFSPICENTYLLFNEAGECIIIDPGCYYSTEQDTLKRYIEANHLLPKYLLNTHCHLDHVFGNQFVCAQWNLQPYIHAAEETMLQLAPASGLRWNLPFENYTGPLHFLKEGDTVFLGDDELKVIEAPGHSPGHICFYCQKQQFIIGGDVLFKQSIGRTDLPGGNHHQLIKSIKEKLFVLPEKTKVYPGHGEFTTIGFERENNPFFN